MSDAPRSPSETLRVPAGAIALSVTTYGQGPALFLIHGIGSRGISWWPVIDELSAHFRLIVPDLRGHGASDKPSTGYLVPDYAADLAALINALDVERPLVMGHSLGGIVTLHWATRHATRAAALVIEDSPLRAAADVAGLFNGWIALASSTVEEAAAHYQRQHPGWTSAECERRAVSITSTAVAVFEELRDRNLADPGANRIAPLAAIQSPALLVHGDIPTGGMVEADDAAKFGRTVPNAAVVRIPGGSHSLHRDRREEFLAITLPFLHEHAPGG
jgi:pimeloyl-ACP methyl ester carboxylesterase